MPRAARPPTCAMRGCRRPGVGAPIALCDEHARALGQAQQQRVPQDPLNLAFDRLFAHPKTQDWLNRLAGGLDRLAQRAFDPSAPNPQPPPPPPPNLQDELALERRKARIIMGFKPGETLTADVLKRRYRELAAKWHPDKHPGHADATKRMGMINHANDVLREELGV